MFGLVHDVAQPLPLFGHIGEAAEEATGLAGLRKTRAGLLLQVGPTGLQHRIAGDAHHVADVMTVAVGEDPIAAKPAVGTQDDPALREARPDRAHQQLEDRGGMLGDVLIAGAQVSHEQLRATKHVQGQETVMVVVAMEKAALLLAVDGVVGGVKIEDQLLERGLEAGQKLHHEHAMEFPRPGPVLGVFHPAQSWRAGQGPVGPHDALQEHVFAQMRRVIEILPARAQSVDTLAQYREGAVIDPDQPREGRASRAPPPPSNPACDPLRAPPKGRHRS